MIPTNLLMEKGGTFKKYLKNQSIFFEGGTPRFYYQIIYGCIRMFTINENGKEYLDGIFKDEESFGESDLFIDEPYSAGAIANADSLVIKIRKEEFIDILAEFPEIHFQLTKVIAKRIHAKLLIAKTFCINKPEERVLSIFKMLKNAYGIPGKENYKVELSRQQIADMIGFRVETVIRTIKRMEKLDMFRIQKGKIYL